MEISILDNDTIHFRGITPDVELAIIDNFSLRHPRLRFIDIGNQSWDGWFRKYNQNKQCMSRAFQAEVTEFLKNRDIPIKLVDYREAPVCGPDIDELKADILPGGNPPITLEDYQMEALIAASNSEIGIIKASTGAGKTEIMAAIAKLFGCSTVIIADIRIVIEEIKSRLDLRDIVDDGVGLFYGGATPDGQKIVVGSIQSLNSPPRSLQRKKPQEYKVKLKRAKQFQKIVRCCDLLMVDECDKASAKNYKNLFRHYFNGRYKYGFSATPFDIDKPIENLNLREHLGGLIYEVSRKRVQGRGRIIPISFYMLAVGEGGNKADSTAFDIAEREIMIENTDFHDRVAKIVASFPDDGTLILVDTSNVEDLGKLLEATIPDSAFIYGKTSKKRRNECIEAFQKRELKCLIGGKILKRGLDLKGGAENLIICGGGKLTSNFDQMIGRAVRRNDRGWSRVFGFYFLNNKYLYEHSRRQLKTIISMGYQSTVVFKKGQIDGEKLVKARFRIPKRIKI